jgi:hypothetical protein
VLHRRAGTTGNCKPENYFAESGKTFAVAIE